MSGNIYDPIARERQMMRDMDRMGSPASDPTFMAAARRAVIAGGGVPWDDIVASRQLSEGRAESKLIEVTTPSP